VAVAALIAALLVHPSGGQAADDDDEPPLARPGPGTTGATPAGRGIGASLAAVGLSGSLRAGYWSSNRRLDDARDIGTAQGWLKLDRKLSSGLAVFAEGYLASEDVFGDPRDTSRLREAYLDGRSGSFDLRVGKQIVAWGRADRLNPTDNLTPRDFILLVPEVDEDRFGSVAAKAAWNFKAGLSLTGIWLPQFRPNVLPLPQTPGVSFVQRLPGSRRQGALKLDQSGGAFDWSVSYYDGFDLNPDLSPGVAAPGGATVNLDYHRTRVIGADAATTRGSYRFAVEAAYTRTEDPAGTNPYIKNPFWYGVFGVERDFTDDLSIIVQVFARRVQHYSDPQDIADPAARAIAVQQAVLSSQYDRTQQGLTARIAKKWLNQTLEGELAGTALLTRDGYAVRPKLSYSVSDSLKVITGFDYFRGSDKTLYGLLEKNSTVFAELRYFF
jgi:hypothetical protein